MHHIAVLIILHTKCSFEFVSFTAVCGAVILFDYLCCHLASGEGIVSLGVRLSHCVSVRRAATACDIILSSEGNALYPVLSSLFILLAMRVIMVEHLFHVILLLVVDSVATSKLAHFSFFLN